MNSFVLYLVYRMNQCRSILSHQLITCVAFIDIILSISVILMVIMRFQIPYSEVFESKIFCPVFGFTLTCFTGISMVLVTILAVERYLLISHHRSLRSVITWSLILMISIAYGVAGIGSSIDNAFAPDPTYTYCWPNGSSWSNILNLLLTSTFLSTLVIITFCYMAIFITCYKWTHPKSPCYSNTDLTLKPESLPIPRGGTLRAISFICCYFLCFLPKCISTIWQAIDGPQNHPFILFVIAPFCISLSTAINPLMVIFLHSQFKVEALSVLRSKVMPEPYEMSLTQSIDI